MVGVLYYDDYVVARTTHGTATLTFALLTKKKNHVFSTYLSQVTTKSIGILASPEVCLFHLAVTLPPVGSLLSLANVILWTRALYIGEEVIHNVCAVLGVCRRVWPTCFVVYGQDIYIILGMISMIYACCFLLLPFLADSPIHMSPFSVLRVNSIRYLRWSGSLRCFYSHSTDR